MMGLDLTYGSKPTLRDEQREAAEALIARGYLRMTPDQLLPDTDKELVRAMLGFLEEPDSVLANRTWCETHHRRRLPRHAGHGWRCSGCEADAKRRLRERRGTA